MIFLRRLCLMLLISTQSGVAGAAPNELQISDSFVLYQSSDGSEFSRTDIIPYKENTSCYFWVIEFEPSYGNIEIEEQLTLPSAARIWGHMPGERLRVSFDKSSAKITRAVDLARGMASYGWCVAKHDPDGQYQFTLRVGSDVLATLPFTLVTPKP